MKRSPVTIVLWFLILLLLALIVGRLLEMGAIDLRQRDSAVGREEWWESYASVGGG